MKQIIFFVLITIFIACSTSEEALPKSPWKICFLDVGQGLSVLLESNGKYALYDTGPDSMNFQDMLKKRNIDTLEWIVFSHFHRDHVGGFLEIGKKNSPFFIKQVYLSNDTLKTWITDSLENLFHEKDVPVKILNKGDLIYFEDMELQVMWPTAESHYTENSASLVLQAKNEKESFLLTGDIEKDIEKEILQLYPTLKGTLLQVPHHGSKNSSTLKFLETLQINYAVISCGKNNSYNHPAHDVLKKLEAASGTANSIFRTDSLGTVCFTWEFDVGIWPSKNSY